MFRYAHRLIVDGQPGPWVTGIPSQHVKQLFDRPTSAAYVTIEAEDGTVRQWTVSAKQEWVPTGRATPPPDADTSVVTG